MNDRYTIYTNKAPSPTAAFSQAVVSGGFVFVAQVGRAPDGSIPGDKSIESQTRQCLENIKIVLKEAGTDMAHVVKTTCYLSDKSHFKGFNSVYMEFFPESPPSRITIFVQMGSPDLLIEMEAIARLPG